MGRRSPWLAFGAALLIAPGAACSSTTVEEARAVDNVYAPGPLIDVPHAAAPSASPTATPAGSTSGSGAGATPNSGDQAAAADDGVERTSSGKVKCPTGTVTAGVRTLHTDEHPISGSDDSDWTVVVRGTAANGTTRTISGADIRVELRVPNADPDSHTAHVGAIAPGSSANWTEDFDVVTDEEPEFEHAHVSVRGWSWGNATYDAICPH